MPPVVTPSIFAFVSEISPAAATAMGQVAALVKAAENGTPFCEKCEAARKEQEESKG
jgi:hypothetical protein